MDCSPQWADRCPQRVYGSPRWASRYRCTSARSIRLALSIRLNAEIPRGLVNPLMSPPTSPNRARRSRLALAFWLLLWLSSAAAADGLPMICRVDSVYDGDTMRVTCNGRDERIRLHCIDAPEMNQQPWGRISRDYLREITPPVVALIPKETGNGHRDRYGRIVAEVITPDTLRRSLTLQMVVTGHAAVYGKYCNEVQFYWLEEVARAVGGRRPGYSTAYDTASRAARWRSEQAAKAQASGNPPNRSNASTIQR